MIPLPAVLWLAALGVGLFLAYLLGSHDDVWSVAGAWGLSVGIWCVTRPPLVAGSGDVSKMSHARMTQHVRLSVRRMLLTIVLALAIYALVRPRWGLAYWLALAGFYQVGLVLLVWDARRSTPPVPMRET